MVLVTIGWQGRQLPATQSAKVQPSIASVINAHGWS